MNYLFSLRILLLLLLCGATSMMKADALSDLESMLRDKPQVQEKVYVHTDNSCYFVGDTLWYKAYVVTADNLKPTNMSKLLYVELLSPDGYLVERQHLVVNADGHAQGQFALTDSLYSGFYEVRAYTRWQLNFNVTHKEYSRDDRYKFYGKQAADDFFRNFEGLYSRVLPIYQKPMEKGNYIDRYMAHRPKQHVLKDKPFLCCTFFPEGGTLVEGVENNVAFELTDNKGQQLDLEGVLSDGTKIRPTFMGRGEFTVTPSSQRQKVMFVWNEKSYSFELPKASDAGIGLRLDIHNAKVSVRAKDVMPAAYAVLCRGKLIEFNRLSSLDDISLKTAEYPTGVNELIIYDSQAQPLASRLFFVNNHDYGTGIDVTMLADGDTVNAKTTVNAYAPVDIMMQVPKSEKWRGTFALAVRDAQTDERGYDNGNIMTDMLLSSELKGFIAYPAYYFEKDDELHRSDLDLLMKVQGWRRYKRVENLRYMPERGLTYEGTVLRIPSNADFIELEDLDGVGDKATTIADKMMEEIEKQRESQDDAIAITDLGTSESETDESTYGIDADANDEIEIEWADDSEMGLGNGAVKRSVLVEAEINKDGETAGAITRTGKGGRFQINLPPYYDQAVLFAKAYNRKDSVSKNMQHNADVNMTNERSFPDYFVKRDMFFPVFSAPYSWYQVNAPELFFVDEEDDEAITEGSRLAGNHMLQTVVVKARRRGKRGLDMSKPAIVMDAYQAYNAASDYGLMFGVADFKRMPMALATYFVGNMGRPNQFNIRALIDGTTFYRNYTPMVNEYDKPRTTTDVFNKLRLNRIKDVKIYTDYDLRTDSGDVQEANAPALTMVFELIPNDAKRYTYRDRRYILDGITYPEAVYSPDYSQAIPAEPTDYRRTLYWNPNPKVNADGTFKARFYNNARETRMTISASGLGVENGDEVRLYYK